MANYPKEKMIDAIHEQTGVSKKDIGKVLTGFVDTTIKAVNDGDKVGFIGFGTFEKAHRKARKGRNPQTGEEKEVPARNVPKFKPGTRFKDALN